MPSEQSLSPKGHFVCDVIYIKKKCPKDSNLHSFNVIGYGRKDWVVGEENDN